MGSASRHASRAGQAIISLEHGEALAVAMDSYERLLWWLFAGSAGAKTRALVLYSLKEQPKNAQQLSQSLHLDYTTVRHHLRVLEANKIVLTEGDKYGRVYFVSEVMEARWAVLESIIKRSRGKGGKTA